MHFARLVHCGGWSFNKINGWLVFSTFSHSHLHKSESAAGVFFPTLHAVLQLLFTYAHTIYSPFSLVVLFKFIFTWTLTHLKHHICVFWIWLCIKYTESVYVLTVPRFKSVDHSFIAALSFIQLCNKWQLGPTSPRGLIRSSPARLQQQEGRARPWYVLLWSSVFRGLERRPKNQRRTCLAAKKTVRKRSRKRQRWEGEEWRRVSCSYLCSDVPPHPALGPFSKWACCDPGRSRVQSA